LAATALEPDAAGGTTAGSAAREAVGVTGGEAEAIGIAWSGLSASHPNKVLAIRAVSTMYQRVFMRK